MKLKKITGLYVDIRIWSWSVVGFWRKVSLPCWCIDAWVLKRMTIFYDIQTFAAIWGVVMHIKYSWQCVLFTKFSEILKKKMFQCVRKSCVVYIISLLSIF